MSSSLMVTEVLLHCQKQMKKVQSEEKLLHYIAKLSRLRIGTKDLIETGIGRTVNQLSRTEGVVGEKAYNLVNQWKALVEAERSSSSSAESELSSSEDEEARSLDKNQKRKGNFQKPENERNVKKIKVEMKSETTEKKSKTPIPENKTNSTEKKPNTPEKKVNSVNCLKPKLPLRINVEIDSTSGINFSDVLSGLDSKKIKSSPKKVMTPKRGTSPTASATRSSSSSIQKSSATSYAPSLGSSFSPYEALEPSPRAIAKVLPYVHNPPPSTSKLVVSAERAKTPNNLTVPTEEDRYWQDSGVALNLNGSYQSDADALSNMMSSRNQRTKVYSGAKSQPGHVGNVKIPTLFEMCIRVLQENIEVLEYTGGIPFDILEPVIKRATLNQLMQIEHYNPYLIEFTDDIWKYHCNQNFRGKQPQEMETWRELYSRCCNERNARFKSLTNKLKSKIEESIPLRKTKLAYVDTTSGPKFSKSKAATIKSGMSSLKTREEKGFGRSHSSSASSGGGGNNNQQNVVIEEASVIIPAKSRAGSAPSNNATRDPIGAAAAPRKPKKAPLMQKTLKSMRTLMRR